MIKRHGKKIRIVFIMVLFFTLGFLVHAFFFPFVLTNNLSLLLQGKAQEENTLKNVIPVGQSKAVTNVLYINGEFTPRVVQVKNSYYLSIINDSENQLMFLASDNPLLRTPRGYGKSEELRVQLYDIGTYEVYDKNNPSSRLSVIVK